jgi:peroxiredoxin
MQQIVDLQNDPEFQSLNVALLSIATESVAELQAAAGEYRISVPLLSDQESRVSRAYDVLRWAAATGEPGHTFVLVDKAGQITWVQDYGAQENGGRMYVPVDELQREIGKRLPIS